MFGWRSPKHSYFACASREWTKILVFYARCDFDSAGWIFFRCFQAHIEDLIANESPDAEKSAHKELV